MRSTTRRARPGRALAGRPRPARRAAADEAPLLDVARFDDLLARADRRGRRAWVRSSRCSPTRRSRDHGQRAGAVPTSSAPAGSKRSTSSSMPPGSCGSLERVVAPLGLRLDRVVADGRRPPRRRLAPARRGPAARDRRPVPHHPSLRRAAPSPSTRSASTGAAGAFLRWAVARAVATCWSPAAPASGKTTLLNALSAGDRRRRARRHDRGDRRAAAPQPHVVRLEARPANAEGAGEVSVRDLVRHALRMRPDRIVVGEVRGGEALDMLQALNTGHDGSLSTVPRQRPRRRAAPGSRRSCCWPGVAFRRRRAVADRRRDSTRSCTSPARWRRAAASRRSASSPAASTCEQCGRC